jgi:hypothetical protein
VDRLSQFADLVADFPNASARAVNASYDGRDLLLDLATVPSVVATYEGAFTALASFDAALSDLQRDVVAVSPGALLALTVKVRDLADYLWARIPTAMSTTVGLRQQIYAFRDGAPRTAVGALVGLTEAGARLGGASDMLAALPDTLDSVCGRWAASSGEYAAQLRAMANAADAAVPVFAALRDMRGVMDAVRSAGAALATTTGAQAAVGARLTSLVTLVNSTFLAAAPLQPCGAADACTDARSSLAAAVSALASAAPSNVWAAAGSAELAADVQAAHDEVVTAVPALLTGPQLPAALTVLAAGIGANLTAFTGAADALAYAQFDNIPTSTAIARASALGAGLAPTVARAAADVAAMVDAAATLRGALAPTQRAATVIGETVTGVPTVLAQLATAVASLPSAYAQLAAIYTDYFALVKPTVMAVQAFRYGDKLYAAMTSPVLQGGYAWVAWRAQFMPRLAARAVAYLPGARDTLRDFTNATQPLRASYNATDIRFVADQPFYTQPLNERGDLVIDGAGAAGGPYRLAPRPVPSRITAERVSNLPYAFFRDLTTEPDGTTVYKLGCWVTGAGGTASAACNGDRYWWTLPLLYDDYEPRSMASYDGERWVLGFAASPYGPRAGNASLLVFIRKATGYVDKIVRVHTPAGRPVAGGMGGIVVYGQYMYTTDDSGPVGARNTALVVLRRSVLDAALASSSAVVAVNASGLIDTGIVASGVSLDPSYSADETDPSWADYGVFFSAPRAQPSPRLWVWETHRPAANGQPEATVRTSASALTGLKGAAHGFALAALPGADGGSLPTFHLLNYTAADSSLALRGFTGRVKSSRKVYTGPNVAGFVYGYSEMDGQGTYAIINRCEYDPAVPCRIEFHLLSVWDDADTAFHLALGDPSHKWLGDNIARDATFFRFPNATGTGGGRQFTLPANVRGDLREPAGSLALASLTTLAQAVRVPWGSAGLWCNWAVEGQPQLGFVFASGERHRLRRDTLRLGLDYEDRFYVMRIPSLTTTAPTTVNNFVTASVGDSDLVPSACALAIPAALASYVGSTSCVSLYEDNADDAMDAMKSANEADRAFKRGADAAAAATRNLAAAGLPAYDTSRRAVPLRAVAASAWQPVTRRVSARWAARTSCGFRGRGARARRHAARPRPGGLCSGAAGSLTGHHGCTAAIGARHRVICGDGFCDRQRHRRQWPAHRGAAV